MTLSLLFPSDENDSSIPNSVYQHEVDAAAEQEFPFYYLDEFQFQKGDYLQAIRCIPTSKTPQSLLYRGWMRKPEQYEALAQALQTKNFFLVNSAEQYKTCHHFPGWYEKLAAHTPKSHVIIQENKVDFLEFRQFFQSNPGKSYIVKDFVNSQKHFWHEACFIPNSYDIDSSLKVVAKFIELQHEFRDGVVGGIVFREFHKLAKSGEHPIEIRNFIYNGELLASFPYYNKDDQNWEKLIWNQSKLVSKVIKRKVNSNFYTVDCALTEKGNWIMIEAGDGGVSSLPNKEDAIEFYNNLRSKHD